VTFVVNLFLAVYNSRYVIHFVVGLALVIAAGLGRLPGRVRWMALASFALVNLWMLPSFLPRDIVPYRSLLKDLVAAYQPGDAIFIDPPDNRGVEFNWQYSQQFTPEMKAAIVRIPEEALSARRIWHITNDWFNETIHATYNEIEISHPRQSGFGKCDVDWCYLIQLMEAPPWSTPQFFGEDIAFWGADIDAITSEAIRMRLRWKVDQRPPID
jgi:hypothetical protein